MTENQGRPRRGAVLFLLDANYVFALKVFLWTLRDALEDSQHDIVVMTDDADVVGLTFLNSVSDRIVYITEKQRFQLQKINQSRVAGKYKKNNSVAYWFLKFFCFNDLGYDYHIFLDTDMLCLDPNFRFGDLVSSAPLSVAPTVGKVALGLKGRKLQEVAPEAEQGRIAEKIRRIENTSYDLSRAMNSGVMYVHRHLLGAETVEGLIDLASRHDYELEQEVVADYFREKGCGFQSLPIRYNFPVLPLYALGIDQGGKKLSEVSILHFNRHKPWTRGSVTNDWLGNIWWQAARDSTKWIAERS